MKKSIHIVCLDCPSPPDYGGSIDMFYKIKALYKTGHRITLHYFDYRTGRNPALVTPYCEAVYAYRRKGFLQSFPLRRPFIIQSRINQELIRRLKEDSNPVLLEGMHCAGILPYLANQNRVVLRLHNDEAAYYKALAKSEKSLFRRAYDRWESKLLNGYQKRLDRSIQLACLSQADQQTFETTYGFQQSSFIPCFVPWQEVTVQNGKGTYCLYHGNLTVAENVAAVHWLLTNVLQAVTVPCVIAGRGIPKRLYALAKHLPHVRFISDPPDDELQALVRDAQLHLLPSLNSTGIKLKLLNALFNGRFCLTNEAGVRGSGLTEAVEVRNTATEWVAAIQGLMEKEFSAAEIALRIQVLSLYNNHTNAEKLSALLLRYR